MIHFSPFSRFICHFVKKRKISTLGIGIPAKKKKNFLVRSSRVKSQTTCNESRIFLYNWTFSPYSCFEGHFCQNELFFKVRNNIARPLTTFDLYIRQVAYIVSQSKVKLKKANKFILFIHFNTWVSY